MEALYLEALVDGKRQNDETDFLHMFLVLTGLWLYAGIATRNLHYCRKARG